MFTILVKRRKQEEKFEFKDVRKTARVIHDDCYSGEASWKQDLWGSGWTFKCGRCGVTAEMMSNEGDQEAIIKTAIDGKERKIHTYVRVICRS